MESLFTTSDADPLVIILPFESRTIRSQNLVSRLMSVHNRHGHPEEIAKEGQEAVGRILNERFQCQMFHIFDEH